MKRTEKKRKHANLEMITRIDSEGYVMSIEFVRKDGGSDKINIEREELEEEEA